MKFFISCAEVGGRNQYNISSKADYLSQGNKFRIYLVPAPAGSDIGLLVIKDETLPPVQRNRQVRKFWKDLPFPVDVIVKNSQEFEQLRDVIGTVASTANKYGRVLYG